MATDDLVLQALCSSTLTEELRDSEIDALAGLIEVQEFKAGKSILKPGDENNKLNDALLILGSGAVEATVMSDGEKVTLHLLKPGDLAGIIGFVGGNVAQISATVEAKHDSKVLVLDRARFETLLNTQPAIVYYIMRGIVRHVQGIVRRMNMQSAQMNNYIFKQGGRY